ncbi:MAG TPA: prefoldin subunit [bacterium]|nr:prefoldin subunit [bacterium]
MSAQDKSAQIARIQEQLKALIAERQRLELEIKEAERIKAEVQGLPPETEIYKSTGPVLYKTTIQEVLSGLDKYKEELQERVMAYQSQESALKAEVERIRRSVVVNSKPETDEA